jgi:hypothetical protein
MKNAEALGFLVKPDFEKNVNRDIGDFVLFQRLI